MSLLRLSDWTYNTGAGGGASVEFVTATGGLLRLTDPTKQDHDYYYGGLGIGYGLGLKIPKIRFPKFTTPEIKLPPIGGRDAAAAGAGVHTPSGGWVYMTHAFQGKELSANDFRGGTVYLDASLSAIIGQAGDIMLMGINSAMLALGLSNPALSMLAEEAIANAPVLLITHGRTYGFQAGFGVGLLVGYVH
ncbi:hypothetical protein [Burkholderia cenocepacia]|uniref:hypothetical protein n=1 Tax=Burkholderia cenocepacia TaxID=95486 RepID=UPI002AB65F3A|nr:hypothetical protein [Burkholderia cenocepacia]